jgi:protease-4
MSGEKHHIVMVLVVLMVTVLFLGMVMAIILKFFGPSSGLKFGDKIGVVTIKGPITDSEPIVSQLVKFKKDKRIKAIILRIDSPGGGVGPSQEIYREIRKTIKTKKVIASMGSIATSGGYYTASAANKIVANPGTITGSIGVIVQYIELEELFKKIGVHLEVLKSGEFKDIGFPHRKLSKRDKEMIRGLIADIQKQFVSAVAKGRGLSVEHVQEVADGRILTGANAKELGLVDLLGNFQDAVDLTKKMVGIKGEVDLVFPEKVRLRLWDLIFQNASSAFYRAVMNTLQPRIEYRWNRLSYPRD